ANSSTTVVGEYRTTLVPVGRRCTHSIPRTHLVVSRLIPFGEIEILAELLTIPRRSELSTKPIVLLGEFQDPGDQRIVHIPEGRTRTPPFFRPSSALETGGTDLRVEASGSRSHTQPTRAAKYPPEPAISETTPVQASRTATGIRRSLAVSFGREPD